MKILVSSIVDFSRSFHNRPHQLIGRLSLKHEVVVICLNAWWMSGIEGYCGRDTYLERLLARVKIVPMTETRLPASIQEFVCSQRIDKILKKIGNDGFDVHFNYNSLIFGYALAKHLDSRNVPTVFDLADNLPEMIGVSPQIPQPLRPMAKLLGRIMLSENTRIGKKVTITAESLVDAFSIPRERCVLIPNGTDTGLFVPHRSQEMKDKLGLSGFFVVGYAGALREWVDFEPVFAALKQISGGGRRIAMLVVGSGPYLDEYRKLARKYGIAERVVFTGSIHYSEMPRYLSSMDVGLIPFDQGAVSNDAIPLKLFEYMASGLPVISTDLSGVRKTAGDLVRYTEDENDYRRHILELWASETLRESVGLAGRSLTCRKYDWTRIADCLERVLYDVAAQ